MRRFLVVVLLLAAALFGLGPSLAVPGSPGASGPEFVVSSGFYPPRYSYYYRFGPGADIADSGDFLVVWACYIGGGLGGMAARAFDANDVPRGDAQGIGYGNIFHYAPESPDVVAGAGQFVAVFTSYDGSLGSSYEVKALRFNLQGEPEGSRIDISPGGYYPEAAVGQGDDFLVAWDLSATRVSHRLFSSMGAPLSTEQWFAANPVTHADPDVALDELGNYTIIWSQRETSGSKGIQGKRFDSSGAPVGSTFQVSQFATGGQAQPAIASLPGGGFVGVWMSNNQDGNRTGVFARLFDAHAQPLGDEFQINLATNGHQQKPDVSADDRGNFLVAWESGLDFRRGDRVMARWFDRLGQPLSGEFQVNELLTAGQGLPTVGMRGDGESVITWFSFAQGFGNNTIRARRYCPWPSVSTFEDLAVCAGGDATFSTTAAGRQPLTFQWLKGADQLHDGGRVSGATGPSLSISGVDASDAGPYTCLIVDACAEPQTAGASAQLSVESPPAGATDLTLQTEDDGGTLRFTWSAAAGATSYVVRSDQAPVGSFTTVVGSAPDPAIGLAIPVTSDTEFFLVAGRNTGCGEGSLR